MAFPSAAGYGNLPNGVFSPTIFSKNVLMFLKKSAIADYITTSEYEGEIAREGDSVKILKQPKVQIQKYIRGKKLESQDLIDEDLTLVIDQGNAYMFNLDDIEQKQMHVNFQALAEDGAVYALKDAYDMDILAVMAAGATAPASVQNVTIGFGTANSFTPLNLLARLARELDEDNVPVQGRFFVGSPEFYEWLRQENGKFIEAQVIGGDKSEIVRQHTVTKGTDLLVHNFVMYQSNNLPANTLIAGHKDATATASSITKAEVLRAESSFANIYRGLHVYGRKVLRPEALLKAVVTSYGNINT